MSTESLPAEWITLISHYDSVFLVDEWHIWFQEAVIPQHDPSKTEQNLISLIDTAQARAQTSDDQTKSFTATQPESEPTANSDAIQNTDQIDEDPHFTQNRLI